jgi:hypothetical protein
VRPLLLSLVLTAPAAAQQGGIEVFAGETLFAAGTRTSISYLREVKSRDSLGIERVEQRAVASIDHGVHKDLTVSMLIPWVDVDLDSSGGDASASGVGDVALLGKYRFYRRDWPRSAFNAAVLVGVETPTGTTNETQGGGRLPPGLQPGSGSWDPFFSLTGTLSVGRWRFDSNAFYKWNTEGAQSYEDGDFFSLNAGGAYRFLHTKYPGPTASASGGFEWRHKGKDEQFGSTLANTGSDELRARAGLTWHPAPNLDIKLSLHVPLHQDLNGTQLAFDHRLFLACGIRF